MDKFVLGLLIATVVSAAVIGAVTYLRRNDASLPVRALIAAFAVMVAVGTAVVVVAEPLGTAILIAIVGISGAMFLYTRTLYSRQSSSPRAASLAERPEPWLLFGLITLVATVLGILASR